MEETSGFVFKVDFDGDLRRFVLAELSHKDMEEKTREVFRFAEDDQLRFLHRDSEGDLVTIATETSLREVYAAIQTSPKIIRLRLVVERIVDETQKPPALDEPTKLGRMPKPQDEAAESEAFTQPMEASSSSSSTPPRRLTSIEKKQRALARLSSRRSRLVQRHQSLVARCDRLEERTALVAERLDTVDLRISNILQAHPELAAAVPELDLAEFTDEEPDRSRSSLFCDSCDIGILAHSEVHFHCEACGNFDLCVRCERQFGHEHDLLRIEPGTRRLPSFFGLSFDEVRTLEACCLDVWHELEASGLMCPRNLAILAVITLLSFVMALATAYALSSAIFSLATH